MRKISSRSTAEIRMPSPKNLEISKRKKRLRLAIFTGHIFGILFCIEDSSMGNNSSLSNVSGSKTIPDEIGNQNLQRVFDQEDEEPEETGKENEEEIQEEEEEEEEEEKSRSIGNITPATFLPFSPRGDVYAKVNIIKASPSFGSIVDRPPFVFSTYLKLVKQKPYYTIEIHSLETPTRLAESLDSLSGVTKINERKNILSVRFQMGVSVHVQFKHSQKFAYFHKILSAIAQLNQGRKEEDKEMEEINVKVNDRINISNWYKIDINQTKKLVIDLNLKYNSTAPFHTLKSDHWELLHILSFFNHIYVQKMSPDSELLNQFPTLLQYMKEKGFLQREFLPLFNLPVLIRGIQDYNYGRVEDIENDFLKGLMLDVIFRRFLERELIILGHAKGMFQVNRYVIISKIVRVSWTSPQPVNLMAILYDVDVYKRFLWDIDACRTLLLSYLVLRDDFEVHYLKKLETQFFEYEKTELSDDVAKMGVREWESDMRHVLIPDQKWSRMLEGFNMDYARLPIEKVSYLIHRHEKFNRIRRTLRSIREEYERMDESPEIPSEPKSEALKKVIQEMDREEESSVEYSEIEDYLMTKISDSIADSIAEFADFKKLKFMISPKRRKYIQKHLLTKLKEKSKRGISEFGCKLVLSIRRGEGGALDWTSRSIMMILDKIHKWAFFKWGFVHSNVMIGNLGLHWFSDSLVFATKLAFAKRLYKEIIALDCHCPLIVDIRNVYPLISSVAAEIVRCNLNYQYVLTKFWGREGELNCQEFTHLLIKALNYTEFLPEVQEYIGLLKDRLSRTNVQEEGKLRFVKITKKFRQRFGKALFGDGYSEVKRRFQMDSKGFVFLETHADIDDFYRVCLQVDPLFQLNHPGIYQLLKGFDRAMWMRLKKKEFDNKKEKKLLMTSELGCLFTKEEEEEIYEEEIQEI